MFVALIYAIDASNYSIVSFVEFWAAVKEANLVRLVDLCYLNPVLEGVKLAKETIAQTNKQTNKQINRKKCALFSTPALQAHTGLVH